MIIRIYIITLLVFLTHLALAQSPTTKRGSYFGITAGVGTVWMAGQHNYGVENFSSTPETAYVGGALGGLTFKGGHTIHVEVAFSSQKQRYQDVRNVYGEDNKDALIGKDLDFTYLRIPLMYRKIIGIKNGDKDIGDSKFFWGAGIEMAALYNVKLDYTVNGDIDNKFVFNGTFNPNIDFPPANDLDLFTAIDPSLTGTFGWERFLNEHFVFQAEIKGATSLFDINHEDWRIPNHAGIYTPSRHVILNFKCSLVYYVTKVKRLNIY